VMHRFPQRHLDAEVDPLFQPEMGLVDAT